MKAIPGVIALNGEAISDFQSTFSNATVIHNDGPATLNGLTISQILNPRAFSVNVSLHGIPSNGSFEPGDTVSMDIQVTASRPLRSVFPIELSTTQGTTLQLFVHLYIAQILPTFSICLLYTSPSPRD